MIKTLILYNSEEYNTVEYIEKLSLILGPSKYVSVQDFNEEYESFNIFIIYLDMDYEQKNVEFLNLINRYREIFKRKKLLVFTFEKNLESFSWIKSSIEKVVSDNLVDYRRIPQKLSELYKYGLEVKTLSEKYVLQIEEGSLKEQIEDFLSKRSVANLSTSNSENSRSTPIEYIYKDNYIYIYSEGGIKFFNLLQNNKISLSIYDSYTNFNELKGMQISGVAYIISPKSEIYDEVLKMKNINKWTLSTLLNVIKIKIKKVEFLNSDFKKLGYDINQIYYF
ncbi:pyridoxamine 5'-phosphate oxidase family protein [Clostridium tunisiense]|uniref:pyridoxamine 5'-phosphate oxidase family protein n=1 Tax=Clostridium tunisiense TaxID=219748 RepID=UPI000304751D|nr:pyridoxamine 5'-phosphate oxidase family protein [Clostridium tunisiense]